METSGVTSVAGIKGGSGRSTVTTNLIAIAAGLGKKGLLVDADDQETAADFTAVRKQDHPDKPNFTCIKLTGRAVRTEVLDLAPQYDCVFIDTGGRDTVSQRAALSVSHRVLIPFAPRSFDIWTVHKVAELIEEARTINPTLRALAFLNRTDPSGQGSENQDAADILSKIDGLEFLDTPLRFRKAYAHAASQGLAVTELTGQHKNTKAAQEMMILFQRCFDITLVLK